jgi:hypothetical protein
MCGSWPIYPGKVITFQLLLCQHPLHRGNVTVQHEGKSSGIYGTPASAKHANDAASRETDSRLPSIQSLTARTPYQIFGSADHS